MSNDPNIIKIDVRYVGEQSELGPGLVALRGHGVQDFASKHCLPTAMLGTAHCGAHHMGAILLSALLHTLTTAAKHSHNQHGHYFYTGSEIDLQWTVQHSCGPDSNINCEIILQYACHDQLRDGDLLETIPSEKQSWGNLGAIFGPFGLNNWSMG